MIEVLLVVLSYLSGSISSAIVVASMFSLPDPRQYGSQNPGATNMLRLGGKKYALYTLLGDLLKGLIPVLIAHYFTQSPLVMALVMLAAFLGHLFPIFFGFKGGKGVATGLGVMLGYAWWLGLAAVGIWLAMAAISRYSSLSALTAFVLTPLVYVLVVGMDWIFAVLVVISVMVVITHRGNIQRLLQGEEKKIGSKKA
jgi:acyl phosphate:glycerol-3-phosphate acyltransferase